MRRSKSWLEDEVRSRLSRGRRNRIARFRVGMRAWSGSWRPLPNLLIIGAMRAGTSSLYKYLSMHPDAHASLRKETEFLSQHFDRGLDWYRAHWPLLPWWGRSTQTYFEASPNYLLHPASAKRAERVLGEARIVVMLRDPVDRAYSHYRHMRALGFESLTFEEAIAAEDERTRDQWDRLRRDPSRPMGRRLLRFSYVRRGRYARQLRPWLDRFGPSRVHVVDFGAFRDDTAKTFARITRFAGMKPWELEAFVNYSRTSTPPEAPGIDRVLRARLQESFQRDNEDLFALLGRRPRW